MFVRNMLMPTKVVARSLHDRAGNKSSLKRQIKTS